MDILAHGLWTNVLYKSVPQTRAQRKITRWGIFFGIFPDLFAFTPVFVYIFYRLIFLGQKLQIGSPEDSTLIPLDGLSHQLYNYSHSLVIWLVIASAVYFLMRRFPWVLLGWALHIGIDIFSHTSKFYPTPFLWPISDFHVNGKSWGDPVFMAANYGLLLVVYLYLIPKFRRI